MSETIKSRVTKRANSPSVLLYSVEDTSVFVVKAIVELCRIFVVVSVAVGWIGL